LPTLREKAIAATRQLAKRQMTWLRAMPEVTAFECERPDLGEELERFLRGRL
jgi:tRNA dimethylallyltransferase